MVTKPTSLMLVAAVCAALFAAPVLAQTAAPAAGAADSSMTMKAPAKAKKAKAKKMPAKPMAAADKPMADKPMAATKTKAMKGKHHKMACGDYAWQSQQMKDCMAKAGKPM